MTLKAPGVPRGCKRGAYVWTFPPVNDQLASAASLPLRSPAMASEVPPPALRPREIARRLDVSERTVYRLIERGQLRAIRVGRVVRIPVDAFEEFLRRFGGRAAGDDHDPPDQA